MFPRRPRPARAEIRPLRHRSSASSYFYIGQDAPSHAQLALVSLLDESEEDNVGELVHLVAQDAVVVPEDYNPEELGLDYDDTLPEHEKAVSVPIHKTLLRAHSSALWRLAKLECKNDLYRVAVHRYTAKTLKQVANFIYYGGVELDTLSELLAVLAFADEFQCQALFVSCAKELMNDPSRYKAHITKVYSALTSMLAGTLAEEGAQLDVVSNVPPPALQTQSPSRARLLQDIRRAATENVQTVRSRNPCRRQFRLTCNSLRLLREDLQDQLLRQVGGVFSNTDPCASLVNLSTIARRALLQNAFQQSKPQHTESLFFGSAVDSKLQKLLTSLLLLEVAARSHTQSHDMTGMWMHMLHNIRQGDLHVDMSDEVLQAVRQHMHEACDAVYPRVDWLSFFCVSTRQTVLVPLGLAPSLKTEDIIQHYLQRSVQEVVCVRTVISLSSVSTVWSLADARLRSDSCSTVSASSAEYRRPPTTATAAASYCCSGSAS
ncbi:MAG: hypothetical protein MHM6MM_004328 [Cercozoa sp. M6MM]